MPSTYTTSLRLTLPATGENTGTWGLLVNSGITQLVDASIAGTASITMTAANYTLSNNSGSADEARAMFLDLGGSPGGSYNVICPAVSKLYFVKNSTGNAQTLKTLSGTGVSVPDGAKMVLRCDGTNVVEAINRVLSSALPVAAGGTGATTLTGVLIGNGTSAFTTVAAPAGTIVGTSDSQTLTNKTTEALVLNNGYTEEVFALGTTGSIALNPVNGSIQTSALTGNPTFTDSLAAGQSIVLMLTNGSSYTVTWPTVRWVTASGNLAPALTTNDVLVFWKVSTTLYGAYVGSGA